MPVKHEMISGQFRETSKTAITLNQEWNFYTPREESFPLPLNCIDVMRVTHTILDVMQGSRIDDYWNIDGSRDLSDSWTGFTQFTLLNENLQTDICGPEVDERNGKQHQGLITCGQISGEVCQRSQKWRKSKISQVEHRSSKMPEGWQEFISLNPRIMKFKEIIKNARKSWKSQPHLQCLVKGQLQARSNP